eukprot:102732-Chlamydomonas_euryale.AAC.1
MSGSKKEQARKESFWFARCLAGAVRCAVVSNAPNTVAVVAAAVASKHVCAGTDANGLLAVEGIILRGDAVRTADERG